MSKILSINKLIVSAAIIASLMSCNGSKNGNAGSGADNSATEKETENAGVSSEILEQVIKEQEDTSPKSLDDDPLPLETVAQVYKVPSELKYYQQSDEFLFEKFYPIGWSKDGHFAYALEPIDEAAGIYRFSLVIKNMINGKDVYVWEQDDEEMETGTVRQIWKDNNLVFAQALNEFKIIPQTDIKMLGTEFQAQDNKYKVTIENKMETEPYMGFEVVKTTNIFLKSPELGSKEIFSYTENDYSMCLGRIVQGVIKSPYENRIAVFVRTEERGYEGPPNCVRTLIVGADLERTFKK